MSLVSQFQELLAVANKERSNAQSATVSADRAGKKIRLLREPNNHSRTTVMARIEVDDNLVGNDRVGSFHFDQIWPDEVVFVAAWLTLVCDLSAAEVAKARSMLFQTDSGCKIANSHESTERDPYLYRGTEVPAAPASELFAAKREIEKLAKVLLDEFGGPTQNESAVEMAIRLLREYLYRERNQEFQKREAKYQDAVADHRTNRLFSQRLVLDGPTLVAEALGSDAAVIHPLQRRYMAQVITWMQMVFRIMPWELDEAQQKLWFDHGDWYLEPPRGGESKCPAPEASQAASPVDARSSDERYTVAEIEKAFMALISPPHQVPKQKFGGLLYYLRNAKE